MSATRSAVSSTPQESRTKPGGGVVAPLRPPVRGGVQAAERGGRDDQPGRASGTGRPASAVPRSNETTPGIRRICAARHRVRRVARPARASAPPATSGRAGQQRRRPRPRSRSAGPAAGPAWPATGAPARPRTRPGSRRSCRARPRIASSSSGDRVRDVAEQQVGVAGQRLGAGGDRRGRRRGRAGAGRAGSAVVLSTATQRARRVRARRASAAMSHTSRPGLAGVSSSTSRTPSNAGYGPAVGAQRHRHAERGQRRGGERADRVVAVGGQHHRVAGAQHGQQHRGDRRLPAGEGAGSRRPPARRSPPPAAAGSGCPGGRSRSAPAAGPSTGSRWYGRGEHRPGQERLARRRLGQAGVHAPGAVAVLASMLTVTRASSRGSSALPRRSARVDALVADPLDLLGDRHLHAVRRGPGRGSPGSS